MALLSSGKLDRIAVLIDQTSTSAGNFLLTLVLVRTHSAQEFGAFGLAMFTMVMLSSLYRYAFVIPVSLWPNVRFQRRIRALSTYHLGVQLLLAVLLLVAAGIEMILGAKPFVQEVTIACFGISFVYMTVDFDRVAALRLHGAWFACVNAVALGSAMLALSVLIYFTKLSFSIAMVAVGSVALTKTILVHLRRPALRHARYVSGYLLRSSIWGACGNLISAVYSTAPQWFLGVYAPPAQVAGFTAVRTPLQPLMVAVRGLDVVDKAAFARINPTDRARRAAHARNSAIRYFAISSMVAVLVSFNANTIISFVLGVRYQSFVTTLILTSIYYIVIATAAPLETVTFAQGKQRQYAIAQGVGAVLCVIAMFPLIQHLGANGAVLAAFIGWAPPAALLLYNFGEELRVGAAQT